MLLRNEKNKKNKNKGYIIGHGNQIEETAIFCKTINVKEYLLFPLRNVRINLKC